MTNLSLLPESAPFSEDQRAWLNGFFAGLLAIPPQAGTNGQQAAPLNGVNGPSLMIAGTATAELPPPVTIEEEFPWHDPTLPLEERLALAEGRPIERRLMAAMAQLDCGACGYLCQTYSEAIARGEEKDLTRCTPGGKETSKKLKELVALPTTLNGKHGSNGSAGAKEGTSGATAGLPSSATPALALNGTAGQASSGTQGISASSYEPQKAYSRQNPFTAQLLVNQPLNGPGSQKDTRLIAIDLTGSGLTYSPGDSVGIFPTNCPDLVQDVLRRLNASGAEGVPTPDGRRVSFRDALTNIYALSRPSDALVELIADRVTDEGEARHIGSLLENDESGYLESADVLDVLTHFRSAVITPADFVNTLSALTPRLYSISSSLKAHPDQVHLTVGVVRYEVNFRSRKGVCSTFLADRVQPGDAVRVFIQPSHGFGLPADPETPIIMVGPGTGIAPFRAFLQERHATGARGRSWLLFGDQRSQTDFLYREELGKYLADGVLSRLDTAFSRDQEAKVYVQHRLMERASEVWNWLQQGAHFYVCGDAQRMAKDVDAALQAIVAQEGKMSAADAKLYLQQLAKAKRYQRDVY